MRLSFYRFFLAGDDDERFQKTERHGRNPILAGDKKEDETHSPRARDDNVVDKICCH